MRKIRLTQMFEITVSDDRIEEELSRLQKAVDDGNGQFIGETFGIGWDSPVLEKVELVEEEIDNG